ncbi:hypothetical protein D5S17_22170 [Pseudonocardiaceae bacterium YIM PH 21723]|nr:hypothetical protein D5S17_22170 [Pseudonocardiaceae bacterium YIM PH 21723]
MKIRRSLTAAILTTAIGLLGAPLAFADDIPEPTVPTATEPALGQSVEDSAKPLEGVAEEVTTAAPQKPNTTPLGAFATDKLPLLGNLLPH